MQSRSFPWLAAVVALALTGLSAAPAKSADVLATHRLSAAISTDLVTDAIAACSKLGFAISAAVVDDDGVTQALVRGDGAGIHTMQAAHDKAYTAVTYGRPGSATLERQRNAPPGGIIVREPHLVNDEGGVPIRVGNELIGAIGVSGSSGKDEDCANAAIEQVRGRLH